jgi:ribosome-binding protein aMBF1 (putative translation factor)
LNPDQKLKGKKAVVRQTEQSKIVPNIHKYIYILSFVGVPMIGHGEMPEEETQKSFAVVTRIDKR